MTLSTFDPCRALLSALAVLVCLVLISPLVSADRVEPPEFISEPVVEAYPGVTYRYEVTQVFDDELAIETGPDWLFVVDGAITGVPTEDDLGLEFVVLTLTWEETVTYQNYTLMISADQPDDRIELVMGILLTVIAGGALMVLGGWQRLPVLILMSGLVWVYGSITTMWTVYDDGSIPMLGFGIVCLGLGLYLMYSAGLDLAEGGPD